MKQSKEIIYLGILTILFGIGTVLLPIIFGNSDMILFLSSSYNTLDSLGPGLELTKGFYIITGGLTIVFGILLMYIGRNYNKDDKIFLYAAVFSWFFVDSYASFFYGWEYNVLLNIIILLLFLVVFGSVDDQE